MALAACHQSRQVPFGREEQQREAMQGIVYPLLLTTAVVSVFGAHKSAQFPSMAGRSGCTRQIRDESLWDPCRLEQCLCTVSSRLPVFIWRPGGSLWLGLQRSMVEV